MASALTIDRLAVFDGVDWAAKLAGQAYASNQQQNFFKRRKKTLSSAPGPTAAYGINALYIKVSDVAASGTLTINLNSFTDVAGQSSVAMTQLKGFFFMLLSSEEDPTITYTPTGIVVGAAGSNPHPLIFSDAASDSVALYGGEPFHWWTPKSSGRTVSSSVCNVKVLNSDSTNIARVAVCLAGCL